MQYFSCGSDMYTEIKLCDLEPFFQNLVTFNVVRINEAVVINTFYSKQKYN